MNDQSQRSSIPSSDLGPRMKAVILLLAFSFVKLYNVFSVSEYLV